MKPAQEEVGVIFTSSRECRRFLRAYDRFMLVAQPGGETQMLHSALRRRGTDAKALSVCGREVQPLTDHLLRDDPQDMLHGAIITMALATLPMNIARLREVAFAKQIDRVVALSAITIARQVDIET